MRARIDIIPTIEDARALVKKKQFSALDISGRVESVFVYDSYVIDGRFSKAELVRIARALTNPLIEEAYINTTVQGPRFSYAIEIGFLPGVTDNVATTVQGTIEDTLKKKFSAKDAVYTSRVYLISGKVSPSDVKVIADSLYNALIERAHIKTYKAYIQEGGMGKESAEVRLPKKKAVTAIDLAVSDSALVELGSKGIRDSDGTFRGPLSLDLLSLQAIRKYFTDIGRKPNDIELETIAQTWSEHCKHTIFASEIDEVKDGIYKTYIRAATERIRKEKGKNDFCVSVFTDNAGAIAFDENYLVTHKVETHNSPSALDPYGGAITGIVGVNRDAMGFGLGAKPVANVYGFCVGNPTDTRPLFRDSKMTQKMILPKRILEGVVAGVNSGGNCSGIPTVQGFVNFDDSYRGKPLVFAGTIGLIPRKIRGKLSHEKSARPGDYIVMVGNRVGQDGIHGATFSSATLDTHSPATAVQIGDPITQKKMSDAIIKEARGRGLYTSITDDGAGGLSSSVAEMARESGGCRVNIDTVPLKYPNLEAWKIWISESQERMTLAVPKAKWKEFFALMKSRDVEATVIGEFTSSGRCVVTEGGKNIMDISLDFLHGGFPKRKLVTEESPKIFSEPIRAKRNLSKDVETMLARPNIASFKFISEQYDHEVQMGSVLKPLQGRGKVNADVGVFRPVLDSNKGVLATSALTPRYSLVDTYAMIAASIDTAIRQAVAAGADPDAIAILDNFCWCDSNNPIRLAELKHAGEACYDIAVAYGTPFISGKDSMFNDFKGYDEKGNAIAISVLPTVLVSAISVLPDATKAVSLDLKFAGDLVYMLGETNDELGGSEYFSMLARNAKHGGLGGKKEIVGNAVPKVDTEKNKKLYRALHSAIKGGLVATSMSVGKGGLAVTLAKMAIAGGLGADISLKSDLTADAVLFSESQGRIVVAVDPKKRALFEKKMKGTVFQLIGNVTKGANLNMKINGKSVAKISIVQAEKAYASPFKNY